MGGQGRTAPVVARPAGGLRRAQTVSVDPVVRAIGPEAHRERQVTARLRPAAHLLQRATQAEVGEVVDRRALDHGLELRAGVGVAAGAEVRPAERLSDGGLVGLQATRLLERYRSGGEVPRLEQLAAALDAV